MIYLTRHFEEKWQERGEGRPMPTLEEIADMLRRGKRLQIYREAYTTRGRRLKFLALYWVPDRNLILKVDEAHEEQRIVTVITPTTGDTEAGCEHAR